MNFLVLQPLTASNLSAAVDLDRRCLGGLWTENGYQREIDSPNSDLLGLYLQQQNWHPVESDTTLTSDSQSSLDLIGLACVWAILNEAHITLLAIDPAHRGQGLGQLLLYALLVSARQRQMEWATLEVRPSNQPAISLYQKFGFEPVGQRPGYYQDTGEAALILWRKGLQHSSFSVCLQTWQTEIQQRLSRFNYSLSAPWLGQIQSELTQGASLQLADQISCDSGTEKT